MKLSELLSNITRYTSDAVIITQMPAGIDVAQQTWPQILFVNDAFSALTGYRSEEVIGKPVSIFCTNANGTSILPEMHKAWSDGSRMDAEIQINTKMQILRWVECACASVCDVDGRAHFMVITARDISERKVMQDATEQQSLAFLYSETRLRAIMNSIADGIITLSEDGCIRSMSSVAERLFGIEGTVAEGRPLTDLFATESKEEIEAIIMAKMYAPHDIGRLATHELMGVHHSGEAFYARITCSILLMGTQKIMVIAARDVSQEKEALNALRIARDAAESASRAKSEFLANMSHELRTPMNGILGLANVLKDAPLQGEYCEFLDALNISAESLLTILNDILDFSKIEAGEMALEYTPFSVRASLAYVNDLLQQMAQKKSLKLLVDLPETVHDWVMGDGHRLQQVLVNLVSNAIKFTASGTITIRIEASESLDGNEQNISFHVCDTGMGISEDYLPHLFYKFSQEDSSNTRKFGGTGLGLAISQQLVGLMGGTIQVESAVGEGSHFYFTLALTKAQAPVVLQSSLQPTLPAERVEQARILVVEDHPINMLLLKKLLHKMGFKHIDHAEHGADALDAFNNHEYDLVFMDCQMPVMDGYHATRAIRELEQQQLRARTPIIAMTANAMVGDQEVCMDAGMDAYVSKPIDLIRTQQAILESWNLLGTSVHDEDRAMLSTLVEVAKAQSDPVDMEHLMIFTDGDVSEERMLFSLFLNNAHQTLNILRESAQMQDREAWCKAAHLLKGASGNLGAKHLFLCCAQAEEKAKNQHVDAWEENLPDIEYALEDVEKFIQARVA